jgi:hypothetical protein
VLCFILLATARPGIPQSESAAGPPKFPYAEHLVYRVAWRMVTAGQADLKLTGAENNGWQLNLDLASSGFVNQLYRVLDNYKLSMSDKFCASSVTLDAQEGKHHAVTAVVFDNENHKLTATVRDLTANESHKTELPISPCTYDIAGALITLRASQLQPGMKFSLPVTNGKKIANVRVEGLAKEKLTIAGKTYNTIRYETFVFDNVLYRRKGRLLIWIGDDAQRVPIQMRFVFGFPLGDITLELEKVERL